MHVLLASHRYFPVPGGTERAVQALAEGLVRRGHRATVITQEEPGCAEAETREGVRIRRLRMRRVGGFRLPIGYLAALRTSGADLFHLHGNRIWCADAYFPFARRFSWPQLLTGYGFYQWEMHHRWWDRLYFGRYLPWAVRAFDRYTTSTERERDQLIGWGVPAARLASVPLGVPLEEFSSEPPGVAELREAWGLRRPLVAVHVGGFFENKRVDRLLHALAPVRERWALVAIGRDRPGSPHDLASCRALAATLGVELVAPGVLDRADLVRSIFAADAVVLGSEYEGFGLAPVEAMAAGRPFVAFAAGAIPEMARRGGGRAVGTAEQFTAALEELDDPAARSEQGRRGRAAVGFYSSEAMVRRYLDVYDEVLSERGQDRRASKDR